MAFTTPHNESTLIDLADQFEAVDVGWQQALLVVESLGGINNVIQLCLRNPNATTDATAINATSLQNILEQNQELQQTPNDNKNQNKNVTQAQSKPQLQTNAIGSKSASLERDIALDFGSSSSVPTVSIHNQVLGMQPVNLVVANTPTLRSLNLLQSPKNNPNQNELISENLQEYHSQNMIFSIDAQNSLLFRYCSQKWALYIYYKFVINPKFVACSGLICLLLFFLGVLNISVSFWYIFWIWTFIVGFSFIFSFNIDVVILVIHTFAFCF